MLHPCFLAISCLRQGASQGNNHDSLSQKQLKSSYSCLQGHRTRLLSISFHYHPQAPMGRAVPTRFPLATLGKGMGVGRESPKSPKSKEPWNKQTNPSYQFFRIDKVILRASHSVLRSLVFLSIPQWHQQKTPGLLTSRWIVSCSQ